MVEKLSRKQSSNFKFEKISAAAEIEDDRENEDDEVIPEDEPDEREESPPPPKPHQMREETEWKSLKMSSNKSGKPSFDMFAEDDGIAENTANTEDQTIMASNDNPNLTDNWDDAEGYYR